MQALLSILDSPLNKAGIVKVAAPVHCELHACFHSTAVTHVNHGKLSQSAHMSASLHCTLLNGTFFLHAVKSASSAIVLCDHGAALSNLHYPCASVSYVQGVFVHSKENVLIDVNPNVRLPRTFRRFCGLMVQLLQKLSIRSTNSTARLLKVRCCPDVQQAVTRACICVLKLQSTTSAHVNLVGLD